MKDYDVVHCHNEPDRLTIAALATDSIVIHDTHDLISLRPPIKTVTQIDEAIANRCATGRVYSTPIQMAMAHRLYGIDLDKSVVIYNYALGADIPTERLRKYNAKTVDNSGTHIVYEGGIGSDHRDYRNLFVELAMAGLHVHIFPNADNPEYESLCAEYPCLHYYQPVSPENLILIMSQFDYGLVPFNITDENRPFLDTCIANKLFEYL